VTQLFGAGATLAPHVLVDAELVYRKASPSVERRIAATWIAPFSGDRIGWESLRAFDASALAPAAPAGAALGALPGDAEALLGGADKTFMGEMDSRALEVAWHRGLKLVQNEGESAEDFRARCAAASPRGDTKEAAIRTRYEEAIRRIDDKLARERLELSDDQRDAAARSREKTITVASGIGAAVLGVLFGRRGGLGSLARSGASTARAYSTKDRMAERAEADVEESRQKIAQLEDEKARLAAELERQLTALRASGEAASGIETLRLTPARKDIAVRRVALAWLAADIQR
jgi:hypothetical protein